MKSDLYPSGRWHDTPRDDDASAHVDEVEGEAEPAQPSLVALAFRAAKMLLILTLITGVAYPLAITAIARSAFPNEAEGSLIRDAEGGAPRGSALIGQPFEDPKYFWGRLSAAGAFPYDARASAGSNLGPTNELLTQKAKARIDALRAADRENSAPVPIDLVTSSASGLDPHISPAAARYQIRRVARERGLSEARVRELVDAHTEPRTLGVLGEPRVNVLRLNLALDDLRSR
jgi:potassium-transporting ATPase KdpC subunit